MPFPYLLCFVLGIGVASLLWILRSRSHQYSRLQADFKALQKNYAWVSSAIDKALLLVEDQDIIWMNDTAQSLFDPQCPKPLSSIFYRNETVALLKTDTSLQCLCLGVNDYLFPATLQVQHDSHSSLCMILIGDENFQEKSTASLTDFQDAREEAETQASQSSIVIIDDDDAVLETYSDMLSFEGWKVHSFTSATLAIQYIEKNKDSISLIITDYQLRELTGVELLKQIQQSAPHLKGLVISGFNLSDPIDEALPFLQKPCSRSTLIDTIEKMLNPST